MDFGIHEWFQKQSPGIRRDDCILAKLHSTASSINVNISTQRTGRPKATSTHFCNEPVTHRSNFMAKFTLHSMKSFWLKGGLAGSAKGLQWKEKDTLKYWEVPVGCCRAKSSAQAGVLCILRQKEARLVRLPQDIPNSQTPVCYLNCSPSQANPYRALLESSLSHSLRDILIPTIYIKD